MPGHTSSYSSAHHSSAQRSYHKKHPPGRGSPVRKRAKPEPERSAAETRQFIQFLACGSAFVLLVTAKLLAPGHAAPLREKLARAMERNIDVQAVFSTVGQTFAGEQDPARAMENVYQAVFGAGELAEDSPGTAADSPDDAQPLDGTHPLESFQPLDNTQPFDSSQPFDNTQPFDGTQPLDNTQPLEGAQTLSESADAGNILPAFPDSTETVSQSPETVSQSPDGAELWNGTFRTGAAMETLRESMNAVEEMPSGAVNHDTQSGAAEEMPSGNHAQPENSTTDSDNGTISGETNSGQLSGETNSGQISGETESGQLSGEIVYSSDNLPGQVNMEQVILNFDYTTPVHGTLTSGFGYREHPMEGGIRFHYGVDIAAETGTEIVCFADGTVTATGESGSYGNYCIVSHAGGVSSLYAHCSRVNAVSGTQVHCGDKIAEVGATGAATGAHLHFELHRDGVYLNPVYYVS